MDIDYSQWVNLLTRWFHIVLGISWIGQTYLFIRMERSMEKPPGKTLPDNVAGQMWMVHGGGFFVVEKLTGLDRLPWKLHWFKWEAMLTWISGIILLVVVYYMGGLMINYDTEMSETTAIAIAAGVVLFAWPIYEALWRSPLGKNEWIGTICSLAVVLGVAYGLKLVMPARAAFFHIGVIFGTIMVANVWLLIVPAQKRVLRGIAEGKPADMSLARRARQSSKQNSYMSVPLIFIMISNHFPTLSYGNKHSTWYLLGYILAGFVGARVVREGLGGLLPRRRDA